MKNMKPAYTLICAILAAITLLSCTGSATKPDPSSTAISKYTAQYPIQSATTLTWYLTADNALLQHKNMGETIFAKELTKRTGVNIEWMHPPAGSRNQQVNVIIASGDLPDIFEANWLDYPGGPQRLLEDEVIIPLNDAAKKWAPHYTKLMAEKPNVRKAMSTDEGILYSFPFIRGDKLLRTFWGPFLRKDLLDKYNLSVPTSIAEWENVLRTVKTGEGNDFVPLQFMYQSGRPNPFLQAFGELTGNLYIGTDGKVHYGQYEEAYKDYLALFQKWYSEALFTTEISSWGERPTLRENFINKKILADVNFPGSGIGYYLDTAKSLGLDLELVAAPYPKQNASDDLRFGHWVLEVDTSAQWPVITSSCKDIELAVRLLDYGYSEQGNLFYNFGIEGESYVRDSGDPDLPIKYTDKILHPKASSTSAMIAEYSRANYDGPFIQRKEFMLNYMKTQTQKDALFTWYKSEAGSNRLLPQLTFSDDEIDEAAQIQADLTTYVNEQEAAFITGTRSLDEFEAYRDQLRQIGIERLLALYQNALERFHNR